MESKRFSAGTPLFKEGDAGDTAFLVMSGVVEIWREVNGENMILGEIKAGELFGEMALISNKPRMATAIAKEDTDCAVIPVAVFNSELGQTNAFLKALVLNLIGHIRSLTDLLESSPREPEGEGDDVIFYMPDGKGGYSKQDP